MRGELQRDGLCCFHLPEFNVFVFRWGASDRKNARARFPGFAVLHSNVPGFLKYRLLCKLSQRRAKIVKWLHDPRQSG